MLERKLFLERLEDVHERLTVLRILRAIAPKVNIDTSSAELPIQISERQ
jgi:hypothetical protein